MNITDNFLDDELFKHLKQELNGDEFPWFFNKGTDTQDDGKIQFTHTFYDKCSFRSEFARRIISPLLVKLNPKAIFRIKANFQLPTEKVEVNRLHIDTYGMKTGIFYINTNDGKTYFDNESKDEIDTVENRFVEFDSNIMHTGTTCTGTEPRIVINLNYIPDDIVIRL